MNTSYMYFEYFITNLILLLGKCDNGDIDICLGTPGISVNDIELNV